MTQSKINKYFNRIIERRSVSERIVFSLQWLIFAFIATTYLSIIIWVFMSGLKSHSEISLSPFRIPSQVHFNNYINVFSMLNVANHSFWGMLFNSIYFSVLGPLITLTFTSMLAYVTCKYKFFGSKVFFYLVIIIVTLPIYGNTGALYTLLYKMKLINSYSQILLAFGGINLHYLYFYAAFQALSWSYAEAAFIDGANDFQVYLKVMFPMIKYLFLALFIIMWQSSWNNYESPLIFLDKLPVLASGIYSFELQMTYFARMDILYAAYFISIIPPLIVFAFCNKLLTTNVSIGGIKE